MAVEAQRLIAISLGKMASSRVQRGGARLHRSLLVASVLHSAQTVALLNDDQQILQLTSSFPPPPSSNVNIESSLLSDIAEFSHKNVDNDGNDDDGGDDDGDASTVDSKHSLFEPKEYCELDGPGNPSDSEDELELVTLTSRVNAAPTEAMTTYVPAVDELTRLSGTGFNDYANSADSCSEFLDSQMQSPARKRRNSDVDEPHSKHLRFSFSNDYPSSSSCVEPMQTDPWQVTNLVYSFSIGFSGLLRSTEASEFSLSESAETDQPHYLHSTTSESIICCSTQIREALDTLTRPVIAMTV